MSVMPGAVGGEALTKVGVWEVSRDVAGVVPRVVLHQPKGDCRRGVPDRILRVLVVSVFVKERLHVSGRIRTRVINAHLDRRCRPEQPYKGRKP